MEEELKMVTQTMEYERLNNGWTMAGHCYSMLIRTNHL